MNDVFTIHISKPDPLEENLSRYDWMWTVKLRRGSKAIGRGIGIREEVLDADMAERIWNELCINLKASMDLYETAVP